MIVADSPSLEILKLSPGAFSTRLKARIKSRTSYSQQPFLALNLQNYEAQTIVKFILNRLQLEQHKAKINAMD